MEELRERVKASTWGDGDDSIGEEEGPNMSFSFSMGDAVMGIEREISLFSEKGKSGGGDSGGFSLT